MTQSPLAQRISLAQRKKIEAVCDEFEAAWCAGARPRLEDYAARVEDVEREVLLRDLLEIELQYRRRQGDEIDIGDYARRFPQWEAEFAGQQPEGASDRQQRRLDAPEESTVLLPSITSPPPASRYEVLKRLHGGGMGEIWLANDREIGRRVAVKRVKPRIRNELVEDRFFAEAQITGQLEHPGVVPVHELGKDADGRPYYVMRLVQGRTLKEVIAETHTQMENNPRSRELAWVKLLEYFLALCRTMAYAHHRGVIHRDIKPDNIMVGSFGETFVVDWGLAKVLDEPDFSVTQPPIVKGSGGSGTTATQDGNVLGSPPYISPEGAEGRIDEMDVKTDVYLLGATLYEILTSRPPRQGSSKEELLNLARTTPPKSPRSVKSFIPPALEAICLRAMSRDKGSRFESAKEIAEEVERYLAGERVRAYAEPWTERLGRWVRRHRRALGRAAFAMFLCAVTVTAAAVWREKSRQWADELAQAEAARVGAIADAQRRADELAQQQRLNQARLDDQDLRRLIDELHYTLADTTPLDQRLSITDPGAADALQHEIDAILARWQPDFSTFPLAEEREELIRLLAELTLWRIQGQVARPMTAEQAKSLLKELDWIANWKPSPASYERLRARCFLVARDSELATEAMKLSKQAEPTPFDYFLQGEEIRTEALSVREDGNDGSLGLADRTRLPEAIALYEQCLGGDPQDPFQFWARLQKGRCHLVLGAADEALAELNQAVALRPQSPWAWSVRGFVHVVLRQFDNADQDLKYALQLDPEFDAARLHLGAALLRRGRIPEGKAAFAQFAQAHPENVHARYYLALAEHAGRDYASALKACSAILESHPNLAPPRLLRAQVHLELGKNDEARADLNHWLAQRQPQLDLASPAAAARRCHMWWVLWEQVSERRRGIALELAANDGNAAAAGNIKEPELYADLAAVLIRLGRTDEALKRMEEGLALDGSPLTQARLRTLRGYVLLDKKDYGQCGEDFTHVTQLAGESGDAQLLRADAHALLGYVAALQAKPEQALREAGRATSQLRNVNNFQLWVNLAGVYATLADSKTGDVVALQDTAIKMLENAIFQAQRAGKTDIAIQSILNDPALKSLQQLPRFREVVPSDR